MSKPSSTNHPIGFLLQSVKKTYASIKSETLGQIFTFLSLSLHNIPRKRHFIKVAIATGFHLFPFRTEQLNPFAPMVLLYQVGE